MMALRSQVLSVYRELLKVTRYAKTPEGQPLSYFEQTKAEFRAHRFEKDEEVIKKLIAKAQSKLGYLQVVSPRRWTSTPGGKRHFVFRPGEGIVETNNIRQRKTSFRDDRIDPEDLERHHRLLAYVDKVVQNTFRPLGSCFKSFSEFSPFFLIATQSRQHFVGRHMPLRWGEEPPSR